jgi:nucleoside-diphosphate-sugar epimerase
VVPAVQLTEVILEAALQAGSQLSSVVVTSSASAVSNPVNPPPGYIFTEADFAYQSLDRANRERGGKEKTPPAILYGASKTAAERAVWKFKQERNVSHPTS